MPFFFYLGKFAHSQMTTSIVDILVNSTFDNWEDYCDYIAGIWAAYDETSLMQSA